MCATGPSSGARKGSSNECPPQPIYGPCCPSKARVNGACHAEALSLEGVAAKRKGSLYRTGRSADWLKMKTPHGAEIERERFAYRVRSRPGSTHVARLLLASRTGCRCPCARLPQLRILPRTVVRRSRSASSSDKPRVIGCADRAARTGGEPSGRRRVRRRQPLDLLLHFGIRRRISRHSSASGSSFARANSIARVRRWRRRGGRWRSDPFEHPIMGCAEAYRHRTATPKPSGTI